jgi:hypothetical protein
MLSRCHVFRSPGNAAGSIGPALVVSVPADMPRLTLIMAIFATAVFVLEVTLFREQ